MFAVTGMLSCSETRHCPPCKGEVVRQSPLNTALSPRVSRPPQVRAPSAPDPHCSNVTLLHSTAIQSNRYFHIAESHYYVLRVTELYRQRDLGQIQRNSIILCNFKLKVPSILIYSQRGTGHRASLLQFHC